MLGVGLGAFLGGVQQGVGAYQTIQSAIGQQRVRTAQREAAEATTQAREDDINKTLAGGLQAPATEGAAPSWNIGGQTFTNEADARRAAENSVGSFYDRYTRDHAPRIIQSMIENGQGDQAEAFQKRLQDAQFQRGIRDYGGFLRAVTMGDNEGARRFMTSMYNNPGYVADGNTVTASRTIKDESGNVTGMSFTIRGRNGDEREHVFNNIGEVHRMGAAFLAPEKAIEIGMNEQRDRDKAAVALARDERRFSQQVGLAHLNQGYQNARNADTQQQTTQRQKTNNDRADERLLLAEAERRNRPPPPPRPPAPPRPVTPEQRGAAIERIRNNLAMSDPSFGRLPVAEQNRRADAVYRQQLEMGGQQGGNAPPEAPAAAPPRPSVWRPPS